MDIGEINPSSFKTLSFPSLQDRCVNLIGSNLEKFKSLDLPPHLLQPIFSVAVNGRLMNDERLKLFVTAHTPILDFSRCATDLTVKCYSMFMFILNLLSLLFCYFVILLLLFL